MGDAGYQMTYDRHHAPTLRLHAYRSLHPHCPHDLLSRPLQTLQRDSKGSLGLSMDDDRNFFDKDPRNLLPRTCQLEPDDPNVQRLPSAYIGTGEIVYGSSTYVV